MKTCSSLTKPKLKSETSQSLGTAQLYLDVPARDRDHLMLSRGLFTCSSSEGCWRMCTERAMLMGRKGIQLLSSLGKFLVIAIQLIQYMCLQWHRGCHSFPSHPANAWCVFNAVWSRSFIKVAKISTNYVGLLQMSVLCLQSCTATFK